MNQNIIAKSKPLQFPQYKTGIPIGPEHYFVAEVYLIISG